MVNVDVDVDELWLIWVFAVVSYRKNDFKCFSGGLVCCFNGVRDRIYAGLFR